MWQAVNFNQGIEDILKVRLVQCAVHQKDKVYDVNIISEGDALQVPLRFHNTRVGI